MATPTSEMNTLKSTAALPANAGEEGIESDRRSTSKRRINARKISYLIHSFVGLKLTLLLSIVLLTGTLAVFAQEINWLLYSEVRAAPQGEKMNPGEAFDKLQAAMPGVGFDGYNTAHGTERTAASALMTAPDGAIETVYVDPYTGEVNGTTNVLTVGTFLSFLHVSLFLPLIGRDVVNFFGVICLIGLITGIVNYPKFWRNFLRKPRFHKETRVWLGDLHRLTAIWSLWFVLIMGVTGTWWFYHSPLVRYDVAPPIVPTAAIAPAMTNEDLAALGKGIPERLSSKAIVEAVWAHDPDFEIHSLNPPEHSGTAYIVRGTHRDLLTQRHTSAYYVNPFSGEIIGARLASDMGAMQRIDQAMHPLHYGTWAFSRTGDLIVKSVWFLFGLGMTGLAVSGLIIYYKRTRSATRKLLPPPGQRRKAVMTWRVLRPWGGPMSGFKYINFAFVGLICFGFVTVLSLTSQGVSGSGYLYTKQQVGEWTISLNAIMGFLEKELDPIQPGRQTTISATIESGNPDGIKFMHVKTSKPRTTRAPGMVIHGLAIKHAHLPVPKKLKENAELWLTIEDWQGNFYQASWPLMPDGKQTVDLRKAPNERVAATNISTAEVN